MRLSEMEASHCTLADLERRIGEMLGNREFPEIFSVCNASFPHVVPSIKFRKRRGIEPEMPVLLSFNVICRYAPPLFENRVIESLSEFVSSNRPLARQENGYLDRVRTAFETLEAARLLWSHLERNPGLLERDVRIDIGVLRETAIAILEVWEDLNVVVRRKEGATYRLHYRTRIDEEADGVCQACGVRGRGRKELFFKPISCKKCGAEGYYCIRYPGSE
jgi:hypothetical protein